MTGNLVGSIRIICKVKVAKIIPIRNPRPLPQPPSWKYISNFFSWTEMPTYLTLIQVSDQGHFGYLVSAPTSMLPQWWTLWCTHFLCLQERQASPMWVITGITSSLRGLCETTPTHQLCPRHRHLPKLSIHSLFWITVHTFWVCKAVIIPHMSMDCQYKISSCGHGTWAVFQTHKYINEWRIRMFRPIGMDPRIKGVIRRPRIVSITW